MGWSTRFQNNDPSYLEPRISNAETSLAQIVYSLDSLGGKSIDADPNFDNSTILQNAVNTLPLGSIISLPKKYRINSGFVITRNISIKGNGLDTGLLFYGSGTAITLGHSDYSTTIENVKLKNFFLDGGNSPSGVDNFGIVGYRALYCEIDVKLSWFDRTANSKGIKLDGGYSANVNYFCATNVIYPRIGQCSTGIFLDNCVQNTLIIGGVVDGNPNNRANYLYGININDVHSAGNLIIGTDVEDCNTGVRVNGVQNQLIRPRIENCNTKFLHDTQGSQTHILASWGLDDQSTVVNNGGQLKMDVMGYDQLSQKVQVVSPSSGTAAILDVVGGSASQAILELIKGSSTVFQLANVVGGNDISFYGLQQDGSLHDTFGIRTNAYISKVYLKGCLTFDNTNNSGDVSTNSIFRHDATGKISVKNGSNVNILERIAGTATIASATTSITVTHGVGYTPTNVICTAQGDVGNIWVTGINSTQFTINCKTAPGSNTVVSWLAS